jgi:hypothetical protein
VRLAILVGASVTFTGCVGCSPRGPAVPETKVLTPAPPPPPGSVTVWGPLRIESVEVVRTEVGWERDFVRGQRLVSYDVTLTQERATCPAKESQPNLTDAGGCRGVSAFAASCKVEPIMRARIEATATFGIELNARCAGDEAPYVLPASGDARAALTTVASACFRARNKFKPEGSWTSLYALTELQLRERPVSITTPFPVLLARVLEGTVMHCRDDGAYLDGTPGTPPKTPAKADDVALIAALSSRTPVSPGSPEGEPASVPLTGDAWKSEHELWERCNAAAAKDHLVAQERCQLLRQLDRFVRDVEDLARPDTPKGAGAPGAPSASSSGAKP